MVRTQQPVAVLTVIFYNLYKSPGPKNLDPEYIYVYPRNIGVRAFQGSSNKLSFLKISPFRRLRQQELRGNRLGKLAR
jgi:hypothetical protein